MKAVSKFLAGAAGAAALALSAAPAQAQSWDRWDRDDGIDVGDILTGVAILGGVALAIDALDGDSR